MLSYFSNPSVKKYSPNDYIWPVFSIRNYIQRADGWFVYSKKEKRKKNNRKNVILPNLENH